MKYYIGIDLGTSAMKLLLVNEDREVIKTVSKEYPLSFPRPSWSEQSPEDWWTALKDGMGELLTEDQAKRVEALGVAGQMHGLVILDREDNVIRPAILWNDGRTHEETEYLNEAFGKEHLAESTANIAFAGFTAPKLLWLKKNEPQSFEKIRKIMLPKDFLNYRMTGIHSTDYSDASGMLLLDVKNKCWSKKMLSTCDISEDQLPTLYESYEAVGTLTEEAAKDLGLNSSVRVIAGAGDNAAAAIGMGTVNEGSCNISIGTSGTVLIPYDNFSQIQNNAIHNFCHANGRYHFMACILSAALCNQWFCSNILGDKDYESLQEKITDEMILKNEVYFLPYLMGERSPINDTGASGCFLGLRPDTTREDMLLAVLEGVSFAIRDNMEIVSSLGIDIKGSTVCGGGSRSPLWLKILASVLNIELHVPTSEQGPGYGVALLSMGIKDQQPNIKQTISPDEKLIARYETKYQRFTKLYPSLKEFFKGE